MKRLIVSLFLACQLAALLACPFLQPQATNNGLSQYGYKNWQQGACVYIEPDNCDDI